MARDMSIKIIGKRSLNIGQRQGYSMADLFTLIPFSLGGIIGLLIDVVVITAVLLVTEKFLAHEMAVRNSFIMGFIAYLIVPLVFAFAGISIPFAGIIVPLIVWIALGEVLLKGSRAGRLKAAAVAFIVYLALSMVGVPGMIAAFIPV